VLAPVRRPLVKLVEYIEKHALAFLKNTKKEYGQFFTPVSIIEYMGSLMINEKSKYNILDEGTGSGMLSAAILDKLISIGHPVINN